MPSAEAYLICKSLGVSLLYLKHFFIIITILATQFSTLGAKPISRKTFSYEPDSTELTQKRSGRVFINSYDWDSKIFVNGRVRGEGNVACLLDTGFVRIEELQESGEVYKIESVIRGGKRYRFKLGPRQTELIVSAGYGVVTSHEKGTGFVTTGYVRGKIGVSIKERWSHSLVVGVDALGYSRYKPLREIENGDVNQSYGSLFYSLQRNLLSKKRFTLTVGGGLGGAVLQHEAYSVDTVSARIYGDRLNYYVTPYNPTVDPFTDPYSEEEVRIITKKSTKQVHFSGFSSDFRWGKKHLNLVVNYTALIGFDQHYQFTFHDRSNVAVYLEKSENGVELVNSQLDEPIKEYSLSISQALSLSLELRF